MARARIAHPACDNEGRYHGGQSLEGGAGLSRNNLWRVLSFALRQRASATSSSSDDLRRAHRVGADRESGRGREDVRLGHHGVMVATSGHADSYCLPPLSIKKADSIKCRQRISAQRVTMLETNYCL